MTYTFSAIELALFSSIFQHPLPLIVEDPLDGLTEKGLREAWGMFLEKFESLGLLSRDSQEGPVNVDETLTAALMGCFGAKKMVSLLENDEINQVFYMGALSKVLLRRDEDLYHLQLFETEEEFKQAFLSETGVHMTSGVNVPFFEEKLDANVFEDFLELYEKNKIEQLNQLCLQSFGECKISCQILKDVHREDSSVLLTEHIGEPCTILTKFKITDGFVRLVKSIYTEKEDTVILGQYRLETLPGVLYEWEGIHIHGNRSN